MHGLINRSIQNFLLDMYGRQTWEDIVAAAELEFGNFEALLTYDDVLTVRVLQAAVGALDRSVEDILEDLGTYLVSHPNNEPLRRLLRFGGATFRDFLHSLNELQDRARLAVPDLELPALDLRDHSHESCTLYCATGQVGFGHVLVGVLRTMADDYGALVVLEYLGRNSGADTISIKILETRFAEGNSFDLSAGVR